MFLEALIGVTVFSMGTASLYMICRFLGLDTRIKEKYGPLENTEGEILTAYLKKPLFSDWESWLERKSNGCTLKEHFGCNYMKDYAYNNYSEQVRKMRQECAK